ncbi:sugar phosphate nucleotidyltransferase [Lutispora thermophila]|uniref:Glucose-1-phosphate cytidylyltransferase n=1 Tax=Lutispora thermophila DSM 19022 TaxID=1122184 RepID=A0A1M6CQB2_9FIRM|nr:sugar phosphate nucleotidyltransferase [Lutispora thermophila]SHI63073.1 glucose-1-phosphate cytidylyltransferase [Lutispora thermophila DSM 19022]
MKVVILCGGKGTRIREITEDIPKPLIIIDGRPMVWHIMNIYYHHGFNDFILPIGYKGQKIKEYFINSPWMNYDMIIDNREGDFKITFLRGSNKWRITFIDAGEESMTGSRIKKIEPYIEDDEFMLTYGDGLADINIQKLLEFHREKGKIATMTGVKAKSQYGILKISNGIAEKFVEKPETDQIINGGFFVMHKEIFKYIDDEKGNCVFEKEPLEKLVEDKQLAVYLHQGFWAAIDTYKDYIELNENWDFIKKRIYENKD